MKISVLIPTYNYGRFLPQAIESVLAQTWRDFDVTVVDDGSDDDTALVCARYAAVKYIALPHRGVGAARNAAVRASDGALIAFLDADDMFAPDKLEKQAAYLDAHPDCSVVFTRARNFLDPSVTEPDPGQRSALNTPVPAALPSALIRRGLFDTVGFFSENCVRGEDTDWLLRAATLGFGTEHLIPEELYLRRIHAANTTIVNRLDKDQLLQMTRAAILARKRKNAHE